MFATSIDGGQITLEVETIPNISPFIDYDWLEITVKDTGPGIAKEFLNDVQNPFFTTWKEQGHVGLGLSIANKIIKAHGGQLKIESDQKERTTVSMFIPLR